MALLSVIVFALVTAVVLIIVFSLRPADMDPSSLGAKGESEVSNVLRRLPDGYYMINDVIVPTRNGTTQIDHVVVSIYGVFVIETKNYTGWIFGSNNSKKWKETFKTESHYFYNPIKQNWGHIYALAEYLNLDKRFFRPVVVFSNQASLNVKSSTPVIYMSELERHILSCTQVLFTAEEAAEIYSAIKEKNLTGTDVGNRHVQNVRINLQNQQMEINQGKCPRCDGSLVLRKGRYGQFYGCSNYPKCRFTQDV